jgi:hypothetical protein
MGENSVKIFRIPTLVCFQGDREIRFFFGRGERRLENDYRKMSTDGR